MVKEDPEMHQFFTLVNFGEDLVDLMVRFQEHNIFLGSVYRFMSAVFTVDQLATVFVPLLVPYVVDGKKRKGFYFDFGRVYWNKPEGYTYKRDRTWQFNNLKPRTYK